MSAFKISINIVLEVIAFALKQERKYKAETFVMESTNIPTFANDMDMYRKMLTNIPIHKKKREVSKYVNTKTEECNRGKEK